MKKKTHLKSIYIQEIWVLILLVPLYLLGYQIAEITYRLPVNITPIWPPAGLALASALVYERRALFPLSIGVVIGQFWFGNTPLGFLPFSLMANVGVLWALLHLKDRVLKGTDPLEESAKGLRKLLFLGFLLSLLGGIIGVTGLWINGLVSWANFSHSLVIWTLGNWVGVLVCAPALLRLFLVLRKHLQINKKIQTYLNAEQTSWIMLIVLVFFILPYIAEDSTQHITTLGLGLVGMLIWGSMRFPPVFTETAVMAIILLIWTFIGLQFPGFPHPKSNPEVITLILFSAISAFFPIIIAVKTQQSDFLQKRLEYQANNDALTGLLNRRGFETKVIEFLENKTGTLSAGIVFLDIDHLKVVNDSCGHLAGDHLLEQVAFLLQSEFKKHSYVARFSGDTFSIFAYQIEEEELRQTSDRVRQHIQDFRFVWEGETFALSASVGAVHLVTPRSLSILLSKADMACHLAKENGGNNLVFLNAEDQTLAQKRKRWSLFGRIGQALDQNAFTLFAQPILPLQRGDHSKHFEVLIRMIGKDGELLLPDTFLPVAEQNHLMRNIDSWVVDQTLKFLETNHALIQPEMIYSINLSGQSINSTVFQDNLIERLANSTIPGSHLCFEITESATIQNLKMAKRFINQIKSFNCRFSLDDFGKGFSSFSYIKYLPIDYIKIDGSFIRDSFDSEVDQAMIRAISEIASSLGLKTIAEYVCTEELSELMAYLKIDYAQGSFHGRADHIGKTLGLR